MQHGGVAHRATFAAIGKAFALGESVAQLVFVFPAAAVDQVVHVGAVRPFGVAKHPQRSAFEVAAGVLGHEGQGVLADEVLLDRFVGAGGQERGFGQQANLHGQQVAEDAREGDHHVDAGASEFGQGNQSCTGQAAITVKARRSAHQGQGLCHRAAFGLEVVGAPQHHGHGLGQGLVVLLVAGQEFVGLALAIAHGKGRGHAEGVQAVQVAASGQHVGVADQVAARGRLQVAAVQGAHQALHFVVFAQQAVAAHQLTQSLGLGFVACGQIGAEQRAQLRLAGPVDQGFHERSVLRGVQAHGVGHDFEGAQALLAGGGLAHDVQAFGNEGVFEFEQLVLQLLDPGGGITLGGGHGQVDALGLLADQAREAFAVLGLIGAHLLPALDGLLQADQFFVQTRMGERRREVADQRGRAASLGQCAFGRVVGGVQVHIGQRADQAVGPALGRQTGLFAGHEFQRAVRAKVQHRVGGVVVAQVAVKGAEGVGGGAAGFKQQAHRVAFVAKARLHRDHHLAKVCAQHKDGLAVGQVLAGSGAPLRFDLAQPALVLHMVTGVDGVQHIGLRAVLAGVALQKAVAQIVHAVWQLDAVAFD